VAKEVGTKTKTKIETMSKKYEKRQLPHIVFQGRKYFGRIAMSIIRSAPKQEPELITLPSKMNNKQK